MLERELRSTRHREWELLQPPLQCPGTEVTGPALTCAAARTFWFKLLPWRGSGGPVNAARHEDGQAGAEPGLVQGRSCTRLFHRAIGALTQSPSLLPALLLTPLPAASRMKAAFLLSCKRNWGEPWAHVCCRIFST